jgi:DNA-binding LacI/PurR family transcriptional regulator
MRELGFTPVPMDRRPQPKAAGTTGTKAKAGGMSAGARLARTAGARIGVLVLDTTHHYSPNLFGTQLYGLQAAAAEHNLEVILSYAPQEPGASLPDTLDVMDGLVVVGSSTIPGLRALIESRPAVWMNSRHEAAGDAVLAGNRQIGELAADYLLARGHRRLGFVCAMADLPPYPTRLDAFHGQAGRSSADAGIAVFTAPAGGPASIGVDGLESLQAQISRLLDRWEAEGEDGRATGLFVPNDMMTAMVYADLAARSIRPGVDVEIISCNNELACLVGIRPRPATIDIGGEAMGARAIEQLIWRMDHPRNRRPARLAVEPLLIEGQVDGERWAGAVSAKEAFAS